MKRRSSTKAPPEEPEFFADRDLGTQFVETLRAAGFTVHAHDDHFPQKTKDVEWLPPVAERRWVALSRNKHMRYDTLEVACLMNCGARVIFPGGHQTPSQFAALLIRSRVRVCRFIKHQAKAKTGPYMARLTRDTKNPDTEPGNMHTWVDEKSWNEGKGKPEP